MHYDKTNVVWIGSRRKCQVRFLRDMNFCWDPGIVIVLGVKLSTDTKQIVAINYKSKLDEIHKILRVWTRRQLTPLGKIIIIKTCHIQDYTFIYYIARSTEYICAAHELNASFKKQFLWDGKTSKINTVVSCKLYEEGEMNMLDVFGFLSAMNIIWLRKISSGDYYHNRLLMAMYPELDNIKLYGSEYANVLMVKVKNPFRKDVVKHYKNVVTNVVLQILMTLCLSIYTTILK